MVEAGRERAAELGLSNVEFRRMDAEHMDLDDDSVDGVLCRWGYMLMADPAAALAETRRVLRDGGRLALSVWSAADDNPWGTISREVLNDHGYLPAPKPGDPGIFSMGREERIRELVGGAGFEAIEIEAIPLEWRFDAFDDYWYFLQQMAGAIALVLERLTDEQRTEVHDEMERKAAPFRANGAYVMPGKVLNAVAS